MTYDIQWHPAAEHHLRQLGWRDGSRVDAAVQRFAETGEGVVESVPDAPGVLRLLEPPFVVRFSLDVGTLHVWAVYRK
jgi:hypothetical protein